MSKKTLFRFLFLFAILVLCTCKEYIQNGDFEQPFSGEWVCSGCKMTRVRGGVNGEWSASVTARQRPSAGIMQRVNLSSGKRYKMQAHFKLINHPDEKMWYSVTAMLAMDYLDGTTKYQMLGRYRYAREVDGWIPIGGDIRIPKTDFLDGIRFYIQVSEAGASYQVDDISITDIPENEFWKIEAQMRIEQIRKGDAKIRIETISGRDWRTLKVEAKQKTHTFAFGSAIGGHRFNRKDDVSQRYRDFFFDNFNWATLEYTLKWHTMEPERGVIKWKTPTGAIKTLRAHGTPTRGHCVYWSKSEFVPSWLKGMPKTQVREEMLRRLYVVRNYTGMFEHWDVNNENLDDRWFEEKLQDPHITGTMFRDVGAVDKQAKLFLNEYGVVSRAENTWGYTYQAMTLRNAGVGLYGIGIQSHLRGVPDPHLVKHRLDVVSKADVPIWITELTIDNKNVTQRAEDLEDVLTLYFSHASVDGVILWGFWDGQGSDSNKCLVSGENFKLNEAGRRWQKLTKQRWNTRANFELSSRIQTFDLRGFYGAYDIVVTDSGNVIATKPLTISKSGTNHITIKV